MRLAQQTFAAATRVAQHAHLVEAGGGSLAFAAAERVGLLRWIEAAALATAAYAEQIQPRLIQARITRNVSKRQQDFTPEELATQRGVSSYLKKIGVYGAR